MKSKQGLRAVLYARFSSDNQRSESIDAQIRAMEKYCIDNRMYIVDKYVDEAKTATSDKRPAFQRMIEDSKKHLFDVVLVHKLDRFSRNRYDSAMYKRTLKMNGVTVFSVLENLDDTPESIMLESMLEGMNEYYSKNLAREVMKGLKENALQCKHTGGTPPLGYYVNEDRKLSVNEHEAEAVRIIFDMFSKNHSYDDIIGVLNAKGYYTKKGNRFAKNSLYSILTNEKYSGVYVYNKTASKNLLNKRNSHFYKPDNEIIRIPNGCPQIVDGEIFQRVQKIIAENKISSGRNKAKHRYIFSGFVVCGYCGKHLCGNRRYSGRNKSLYVTYRCFTNKESCINKEINRYYLEDFVLAKIKDFFFYKDKVRKMYSKINKYIENSTKSLRDDIKKMTSELSYVDESLKNVTKAIENGISVDEIFSRSKELQAYKEEIQMKIAKNSKILQMSFDDTDVENTIAGCKKFLKTPINPDNRDFLKQVLDKIIVKREDVQIVLKTGLFVNDEFDTVISVSRDEVYKFGKEVENA